MKKTTKILAVILAILTVFSAFSISGFAAGNSIKDATTAEFGIEYSGTISESDPKEFYKLMINESGIISVKVNAFIECLGFYFYNENGTLIWDNDWVYWNQTAEIISFGYSKVLTAGTYYLALERNRGAGDYTVSFSNSPSGESFVESGGGINENLKNATEISLNETYNGCIAFNESRDFYKFTLNDATKVKISFKGNIHPMAYSVYNSSGNVVWEEEYWSWDPSTGINAITKEFNLSAGTYYFCAANAANNNHFHGSGNYTFSVTCDIPATLTSISLASAPSKTEYIVGDTIDVNGLSVEATYSDGTKKTVEGYSITGFDSSSAGTKTVTITYTENGVTCECSFEITVSEPAPAVELTGIACTSLPSKISYKVGESFDKSGLAVTAQYSDGSSKLVSDYTLNGFDSSSAGTKTITVSYSENGITKTCTFNVTVVAEVKLIAISVASMPAKTVYQVGEAFDTTGLIVNAFYDNGTSAFVTDYTVSGFDSETAGTKTVIVTYTDKGITKSCSFEVTVEEPADEGNFFTNLINSIMNFFMSIIEFFTSLLGG